MPSVDRVLRPSLPQDTVGSLEEYNFMEVPPGVFICRSIGITDPTSLATFDHVNSIIGCIRYDRNKLENSFFNRRRKVLHTTSQYKFHIWYSGTVADAAKNARVIFSLAFMQDGDLITDPALSVPVPILIPGPGTINCVKKVSTAATNIYDNGGDVIVGRIARDGPHANDDYTGDIFLLHLSVEFIP